MKKYDPLDMCEHGEYLCEFCRECIAEWQNPTNGYANYETWKGAAMRQITKPPQGTFRGTNFLTPEPLRFFEGNWHGRKVYVELSRGEGFDHQPIYGVTVRGAGGAELWRPEHGEHEDPSRMFHSSAEAMIYIRDGLTEGGREDWHKHDNERT